MKVSTDGLASRDYAIAAWSEVTQNQFEERLRRLIQAAWLNTSATDTLTYFLGETADSSSATSGNGANRLTFTALGLRPPGKTLTTETDFQQNNQSIGPVGGPIEISISTTAVGQAPGNTTGLVIREQTPADTDPTQGGTERLFDSRVTSINFEFWDGTTWQQSWTTSSTRRLPSAVRVTYSLDQDSRSHVMVVPVPLSDVTADNPATGVTGQ